MFHFVGSLLSPAGGRARLCILMYHRALATPDPMLADEVDATTFERHMRFVAREFNVLTLGDACARLANGGLPARAACVTFDDGYADNERVALPILKRIGIRATFFVATGYCDGGIMFNDAVIEAVRAAPPGEHDLAAFGLGQCDLRDPARRRMAIDAILRRFIYRPPRERGELALRLAAAMGSVLPTNLMMSRSQVKRLHDEGMEIGGHTVNHPILALLDEREAREEIVAGKRTLEEIVGAPIEVFAYPNGKPGKDYGQRDIELVRNAGFCAAVSTVLGIAHGGSDPFQLPRFGAWDKDPLRLGARLMLACARTPARRRAPTSIPSPAAP